MNCDILRLPLSLSFSLPPPASLHALLIIEILPDPCHSLHALADPPSTLPSFICAALAPRALLYLVPFIWLI